MNLQILETFICFKDNPIQKFQVRELVDADNP